MVNNKKMKHNIINGEKCCWRCGLSKNSQEVKDGMSCSVWGTNYKRHLWTIRDDPTHDTIEEHVQCKVCAQIACDETSKDMNRYNTGIK